MQKSSSGGYAGLMQRMNKARSGGGGAAQPHRMAPAHRARPQQLQMRSSSHAMASHPAGPNPQQAAMAKQVMEKVKETMSNIQLINQHTQGHPHGAALKQIHALRATLKSSMGKLKQLTGKGR